MVNSLFIEKKSMLRKQASCCMENMMLACMLISYIHQCAVHPISKTFQVRSHKICPALCDNPTVIHLNHILYHDGLYFIPNRDRTLVCA